MGTQKLYVGNLPYSASEDQLKTMFSEAGTVVSAAIINDKFSGRSKGFAFVEMDSKEGLEKAVELFNGKDMGGRAIVVNEARPREERPSRPSGGGSGGNNRNFNRDRNY